MSSAEIRGAREALLQFALFRLVLVGALVENDARELLFWLLFFATLGAIKLLLSLSTERFATLTGSGTVQRKELRAILHLTATLTCAHIWLLCALLLHALWNVASLSLLSVIAFEHLSLLISWMQGAGKIRPWITSCTSGQWFRTPNAGPSRFRWGDWAWLAWKKCTSICCGQHRRQHTLRRDVSAFATCLVVLCGSCASVLSIYISSPACVRWPCSSTALFRASYVTDALLRISVSDTQTHQLPNCKRLQLQGECCAICREKMAERKTFAMSSFISSHLPVLSWMEHKQQCPTCRSPLQGAPPQIQATARVQTELDPELLQALQGMDLGVGSGILPLQQQQELALNTYRRRRAETATALTNRNGSNEAHVTGDAIGRAILGQSLLRLHTPSWLTFMPQVSFRACSCACYGTNLGNTYPASANLRPPRLGYVHWQCTTKLIFILKKLKKCFCITCLLAYA